MGIKENICELRRQSGLSQAEFAKVAGVSRGAVSQWEIGWSEPRMGAIQALADHFGIYKSNIVEDGGMEGVDIAARIARPRVPGARRAKADEPAYLPMAGRVHAGDAQEPEITDGRIPVPADVAAHHPHGYFLEVEGDCMSRVYPEGSLILIDPDMEPRNGSIAVVSIDGADYVMRRLYRGASVMILSPDSYQPGYQDIVVSEDHTVEFVGVVVWYQPRSEME
jgi:repressor LexA